MELKEIKKNLFDIDIKEYALAHCISLDCAMGAGIAKVFRKKYPKMPGEVAKCIADNSMIFPCTVAYIDDKTDTWIFNLITKERYYQKPTYSTLTVALTQMRDILIKQQCRGKIAMPLIGCGLDKLQWPEVKKIIEEVFKDTNVEILVCKL